MATVGRVLAAGTMAAQTIEVEGRVGNTPGVHDEIGTHMAGRMTVGTQVLSHTV